MKSSGLLETGEFIVTYAKIVDRVLVGLPAAQREVVTIIGNSAFHNTMKILIETEEKRAKDAKKRNSRKRQSKQ